MIQYEVKQGEGEQVFDAAALEDGKITVEVTLHYIELHYITLHITLHHSTLDYITKHYIGDRKITVEVTPSLPHLILLNTSRQKLGPRLLRDNLTAQFSESDGIALEFLSRYHCYSWIFLPGCRGGVQD